MKVRPFAEVADQMTGRQGWQRREGDVVFDHNALGRVVHVAICDDMGAPRYDQFLHCEPVGAVTVPVNTQGQYGLVRVERPTFRDPQDYRFDDLDFDRLGQISLEFPRGFPHKGEASAQTARREAKEELNSPILEVRQLGLLTPNTTFHPHRIPVFLVRVNETFQGSLPPDVNEKILKVEWWWRGSVERAIASGEIYCGMTLSAWALAQTRA